jgi:hypothetical protein
MASPGDLGDERSVIRTIEDLVNHAFETSGLRVRVVGWELTTPGFGRPQAQINPMVNQCDVFIGLLNRRWGSETGEFSSGFEEEFEIALRRRETGDTPAIAMFFAEVPADLIADPGPQLSKVLEFKARIQRERIALYQEFRSTDNLSTLVLAFLANHVLPLAISLTAEVGARGSGGELEEPDHQRGPSAAETTSGELPSDSGAEVPPALRQLSETFKAFDSLICGQPTDTPPDADRLALIARSFERHPQPIGAHLVNRLYRRRKEMHLANPEVSLWLRTFFSDVGLTIQAADRTVPGWAILRSEESSDESVDRELVSFADDTEVAVARGAIRLMTRLKRRPRALWPEATPSHSAAQDREDDVATTGTLSEEQMAVQIWVGMFKALPGVDAAFDYLVLQVGDGDDSLLGALARSEDLDKASRDAVLALTASRQGDFAGLSSLAPSSHSRDTDGLTTLLGTHIHQIPGEALDRLARFGKPVLRRLAIKRLLGDGEVNEQILKDALAWKDSETLHMLLDQTAVSPALGEAMLTVVAKDSTKYSDGAEAKLLAKLRTPEELRAMHGASPFNDDAWHALNILLGSKMLDEVRQILDTDALAIRERLADVAADHPSLIPYFASKYRAIACTLIGDSTSKSVEDVTRLAREVERQDLVSRGPALRALARVVTAETLPVAGEILTTLDDYSVVQDLPELLSVSLASVLADRWRTSEIASLRDAAVRWFLEQPDRSEPELIAALYGEDSESRITALDNLVRRLDRNRLEALLESYPQGESTYWYNVIAALDQHLFAPDCDVDNAASSERQNGTPNTHA